MNMDRKTTQTAFVTVANFVSYNAWTLLNKYQFGLYGLTFSVILTAYQMIFVGVAAHALLLLQQRSKAPTAQQLQRVVPLGLVRAADIGFGNAALRLLSVALQQIIKSTIPVYVCILSAAVLRSPPSARVWATLIPIVGGVVLASWGELSASWLGVVMAVVSCVARAGKAIINDLLLHAETRTERLDAVQIMSFESPISGLLLSVVSLLLESAQISAWWGHASAPYTTLLHLLGYNSLCGVLMFINQWSYISIIQHTSSVTCQVLMNLKMVILIVVSVVLFASPILPVHMAGIAIAAGGCTLYAQVKASEQKAAKELREEGGGKVLSATTPSPVPSPGDCEARTPLMNKHFDTAFQKKRHDLV